MSKHEKDKSTVMKDVDSGWAIVAVIATFICFLIQTGSMLSKGVYMPSYLDHFHQTRSNTFWIGSVYVAFYHFGSLISSFAVPKFGARMVVMAGGILLALVYAILSVVESINILIAIYGILGGIGGIFVISGCIAILPSYFKENIFIASGITFGGGGVGVMSVGGLTEYLIDLFDWRGALLIQSGVCLHVCVCASLMYDTGLTPPSYGTLKRRRERRPPEDAEGVETVDASQKLLGSPRVGEMNGNDLRDRSQHRSVLDLVSRDPSIRFIDESDDACHHSNGQNEFQTSIDDLKAHQFKGKRTVNQLHQIKEFPQQNFDKTEKLIDGQLEQSENFLEKFNEASQPEQQLDSSLKNDKTNEFDASDFWHRLRTMLVDHRFWLITFATQFASMAGFTTILFFKVMLTHANLGSRLMVVFMGSGGVFGRVSAGFIARHVNRFLYFSFMMLVLCCDLLLLLVADARWMALGIGFTVTTCQGTCTVLHTLMALDVYGRSGMHLAWTWSMAFAGIGILAAGPIGGHIADVTDGFTGTVLLFASWALTASMIGLVLYFIQKKHAVTVLRSNGDKK